MLPTRNSIMIIGIPIISVLLMCSYQYGYGEYQIVEKYMDNFKQNMYDPLSSSFLIKVTVPETFGYFELLEEYQEETNYRTSDNKIIVLSKGYNLIKKGLTNTYLKIGSYSVAFPSSENYTIIKKPDQTNVTINFDDLKNMKKYSIPFSLAPEVKFDLQKKYKVFLFPMHNEDIFLIGNENIYGDFKYDIIGNTLDGVVREKFRDSIGYASFWMLLPFLVTGIPTCLYLLWLFINSGFEF